MRRNAGLYIHIPYCVKKCRYCDFVSYPVKEEGEITSFLEALISETKLYETEMQDVFFDTVFLGGGTPSLIDGADFFFIYRYDSQNPEDN